jgi:hypothetical protein
VIATGVLATTVNHRAAVAATIAITTDAATSGVW